MPKKKPFLNENQLSGHMTTIDLLQKLEPNRRRGSKPRCHWITHGRPEAVAQRLTALMAPFGHVSTTDRWMPQGFDQTDEAEFHKSVRLLRPEDCATLKTWWFKISRGGRQRSPNFDIASTCTVSVDGAAQPGLLLVEAKAHSTELQKEAAGKVLKRDPSTGEKANHEYIGQNIRATNPGLASLTGLTWNLSHERCYQLSNRFAWSCKLMELGYPVVLVYLGFLRAEETRGLGETFPSPAAWESLVRSQAAPVVPNSAWNQAWRKNNQTLIPLIRSVEVPWDRAPDQFIVT